MPCSRFTCAVVIVVFSCVRDKTLSDMFKIKKFIPFPKISEPNEWTWTDFQNSHRHNIVQGKVNCGAILESPRMSRGSLWESHNDPPKWRC